MGGRRSEPNAVAFVPRSISRGRQETAQTHRSEGRTGYQLHLEFVFGWSYVADQPRLLALPVSTWLGKLFFIARRAKVTSLTVCQQ